LHVDGAGLDALERHRGYALDHEFPQSWRNLTSFCRAQQEHLQNKTTHVNLWVTIEERLSHVC
jgi:hypothetical protein